MQANKVRAGELRSGMGSGVGFVSFCPSVRYEGGRGIMSFCLIVFDVLLVLHCHYFANQKLTSVFIFVYICSQI